MAQTVVGVFDTAHEAQRAVDYLLSNGFDRSNVDIANNSSTVGLDTTSSQTTRQDNDNGGGIGGFFRSLFGGDDDHDDVRNYSQVASRGSIVTVHTQSREESERAAQILDNAGAIDVNERAEQYRSGTYAGAATTTQVDTTTTVQPATDVTTTGRTNTTDVTTGDVSVPILEENLQVGKRVVETGAVRLRSRIIERPVEEHIRLRSEHVHVERTAVNRPATDADFGTFKEGQIEVTERAEVPVVGKEARVVEEIQIGKEVEQREETVRGTVRRTEVDVENIDSTDVNRGTTNLRGDDDLNSGGVPHTTPR